MLVCWSEKYYYLIRHLRAN